ncbi:MAG: nickel-dependent lactate racemase [Acidobacteriota bacterium]|nr:MAG: nickel-dependent lactate racemase [Acidobacteriota bacterium]
MRIHLQYGRDGLEIDVPSDNVAVLAPRYVEGLADEESAFREAVRNPIESAPLRELIGTGDRVAIVIPDITRPLPSHRLLSWLFEELDHIPAEQFVIVNGTGSHRVNTHDELAGMVGHEILNRYRVINHNSHDPATLGFAGRTRDGRDVYFNKEYVEADRRIVLGFIEPHLMAGFSGGYKGIFPAVADIDSIMHYHRSEVVGSDLSTWGQLENNPTREQVRHNGSLLPVDFCINVTLNRQRRITGFFCGNVLAAHARGCEFSKSTVMTPCPAPFPIVVTTNSGYPLDQNLYQAVKGMSAAAQVVAQDGLIIAAAKCNDGFPEHGNFKKLLFDHDSPRALLETVLAPGFSLYDQWEAQLLAMIQLKSRVALVSDIPDQDVRKAFIEPVSDIGARIEEELNRIGRDAPIAVMPEGPMTIPYLEQRMAV